MKTIIFIISLVFRLNAQETASTEHFKELYEWTQSPDFTTFSSDTLNATEGQVILRFDYKLFTGPQKFEDFFSNIGTQYKNRLYRITRNPATALRPEDLTLSIGILTRMAHLWNHIFKDLAENQMTLHEKIMKIDNSETRSRMLQGWTNKIDKIIHYYSKWIHRFAQIYSAEKSWVTLIQNSNLLSTHAKIMIPTDLFNDEYYANIEQFVPTLRGLRLAFNATTSLQRSTSSPIGKESGRPKSRKSSAPNIQ